MCICRRHLQRRPTMTLQRRRCFLNRESSPGAGQALFLLELLTGVGTARPGESENTLSVRTPLPHTTNPYNVFHPEIAI